MRDEKYMRGKLKSEIILEGKAGGKCVSHLHVFA